MSEVLLTATQLVKRFGGLAAVDGVSLELWRGKIHAVIGPNGAGKSTLTNLISGDLPPTNGVVSLLGQDITGRKPEAISKAGLGRSYQKTNVFLPFTVRENLRLAAQSRDPQRWRWLTLASGSKAVAEQVDSVLELCGLVGRQHVIAGELSHGEQRQVEIGMCLATRPQVLLLDEPLAGMGKAEAQVVVELLLSLRQNHALLLVEHDMDAVFALADHLTVMVNGQAIASDTPTAIRANASVQAAYLGESH